MAKKKSAEELFAEAHGLTMQQWQAIDDRFSTPDEYLSGIIVGDKPKKKSAKKATTKKKK